MKQCCMGDMRHGRHVRKVSKSQLGSGLHLFYVRYAHCTAIQYNAMQYSTVQLQCNAVKGQCHTVQYFFAQ